MRALILGGTEPARLLAGELDERGWSVTTALPEGAPYPAGVVRIDGFGGAAGMAAWLIRSQTQIIIDASHPFAEEITEDAAEASRATGVPVLGLSEPAWRPGEGDQWTTVETIVQAADHAARHFHHTLVDIGEHPLTAFAADRQNLYVIRGAIQGQRPARYRLHRDNGPVDVAGEKKLLRDNQIDGLVLRNTGDGPGQLTLQAARDLRTPVVLLQRPRSPRVWGRVSTVEEALNVLIARRRPDPDPDSY